MIRKHVLQKVKYFHTLAVVGLGSNRKEVIRAGSSGWSSWSCSNYRRCSTMAKEAVTATTASSSGAPKSVADPDPTKHIRNIGIMAHIDAGKTTTTERMLYLSGAIQAPGEVHRGDTVTDYLPQERERGITIQSAVVGFKWANDWTINLIDTPGHVDFTFEVQRALRVVDSAVAILDASAGVEPQTLTVWRQARNYNLPTIIYLNKMDKAKASIAQCLQSIKDQLKCSPILLQLPIYKIDLLHGIIDLINLKKITFDAQTKGLKFNVDDCSNDPDVVEKRHELINQVCDLDNTLAEHVIEVGDLDSVKPNDLNQAIRRITLSICGSIPVLIGSSYKHVGVQPLLDAIIKFLPSPSEQYKSTEDKILTSVYGNELCVFAFKILHDPQLGPITFVRVFGGALTTGAKLYNVTRKKAEKLLKIYLPFADDLKEVPSLTPGQVGVVTGLKGTITGDTLTSSAQVYAGVEKKLEKIRRNDSSLTITADLSGVEIPEPVFFCAVEAASLSHQKNLERALECLQREDPSLQVHVDPDTMQTVLKGMGELHLQVIHSRLMSDFKVDADLGKMMVAYKETISAPVTQRMKFERKFTDQRHCVEIELEMRPRENLADDIRKVIVRKGAGKDIQEALAGLTEPQMNHIKNGVESALINGPKLGFPVIQLDISLNYFQRTKGTSDTIIEAAAANCIRQCLQNCTTEILEPVARLEIVTDEKYQQFVVDDLNRRRFQMEVIDSKDGNKVIRGTAPLSELRGYSTAIRTVSSGMATFSLHFSHYQKVGALTESKIISETRGF